ncbi:hypothetical protein ACU8KH_05465 [Lachancea thermotolerans]
MNFILIGRFSSSFRILYLLFEYTISSQISSSLRVCYSEYFLYREQRRM